MQKTRNDQVFGQNVKKYIIFIEMLKSISIWAFNLKKIQKYCYHDLCYALKFAKRVIISKLKHDSSVMTYFFEVLLFLINNKTKTTKQILIFHIATVILSIHSSDSYINALSSVNLMSIYRYSRTHRRYTNMLIGRIRTEFHVVYYAHL